MIHSLCDLLKERKLNNVVPYFCNSKGKDNAGYKLQNTRRKMFQLRKRRKYKFDLKSDLNMQLKAYLTMRPIFSTDSLTRKKKKH